MAVAPIDGARNVTVAKTSSTHSTRTTEAPVRKTPKPAGDAAGGHAMVTGGPVTKWIADRLIETTGDVIEVGGELAKRIDDIVKPSSPYWRRPVYRPLPLPEPVRHGVQQLRDGILKIGGGVVDVVVGAGRTVYEIGKAGVLAARDAAVKLGGAAVNVVKSIPRAVGWAAGHVYNAGKAVVHGVVEGARLVGEGIKAIPRAIGWVAGHVYNAGKAVVNGVVDAAKGAAHLVGTGVGVVVDGATAVVNGVVNTAKGVINGVNEMFGWFGDGVKTGFDDVTK